MIHQLSKTMVGGGSVQTYLQIHTLYGYKHTSPPSLPPLLMLSIYCCHGFVQPYYVSNRKQCEI